LITWTVVHDVGVAMIDKQHRKLAELLNDLSASLSRGDDTPAISAKLASALSFARHHFECEERLMDEHGFAEAAAHRDIHACLLNDLENFSVGCDMRSLSLTTRFLQEWLLRHCDSADRELAKALRAFGVH
jgi:hemerythrin-like metal-binding protein